MQVSYINTSNDTLKVTEMLDLWPKLVQAELSMEREVPFTVLEA